MTAIEAIIQKEIITVKDLFNYSVKRGLIDSSYDLEYYANEDRTPREVVELVNAIKEDLQ